MAKKATEFTCARCGQRIQISEEDESTKPIMINGKKYCRVCGEKKANEAKQLSALRDYLNDSPYLVNGDKDCWPNITRQIKYLVETDGFKYSGILLTLKFIYEEKDNGIKTLPEFTPDGGIIWIVEKYYPVARKREEERRAREKLFDEKYSKEFLIENTNLPPNIIKLDAAYIRKSDLEAQERMKDRLYGPAIDLNEIADEEE